MAEYKCIQRLKTSDGVIHEVGSLVALTGTDEASAVKQAAVVAVTSSPDLAQLEQERTQLDQEIAQVQGSEPA